MNWPDRIEGWARRVVPDPFVLAIMLTAAVWVAGWVYTGDGLRVLDGWTGPRGLWSLLAFGMQMCLVLVTGHAVAASRPVRKALDHLASRPQTPGQAILYVCGTAMGLGMLNWGLGLVAGAFMARAVGTSCARRRVRVHYPLLAACGYTAMLVWHGGFSGSAPLKVTTRSDLIELLGPQLGNRLEPINLFQTLLSPLNGFATVGVVVWVTVTALWLSRRERPDEIAQVLKQPLVEVGPTIGRKRTVADARWLGVLLALPLTAATLRYYSLNGVDRLDPNAVNLTLLTAGVWLHGSPASYGKAVQDAVQGCSGIILQFPLYAGIMGITAETGLAAALAEGASGSGSHSFLVLTFLSAGLLNFLVPSGGGQWALQGPIALQAAEQLSLPLGHAVMAVAYGDQWTNMLQPFWALPLLSITGVRAGALVGTTAIFFAVSGLWFMACLVAFAG